MSVVNVTVKRRYGESIERMVKRFSKKVNDHGVLQEYKARKAFVSPSERRRIKKDKAIRLRKREQS